MKVYISVDIEGISGVVVPEQAGVKGRPWELATELMVAETNAAIAAAFDSGATEVVVNDSHGNMTNLQLSKLDPRADLISGPLKANEMMEGIDETFAAALFIGYHSRVGSLGVLAHTYYGSVVAELRINGRPVGETALNAGLAGHYGVPVVMVAGDSVLAEEAASFIPNVTAAVVKWPVGNYAARNLSPKRACKEIADKVKLALSRIDQVKPLTFDLPVTFTVKFYRPAMAASASLIPGTVLVDPLTVEYTAPDYLTAFRAFIAMTMIGGAAKP